MSIQSHALASYLIMDQSCICSFSMAESLTVSMCQMLLTYAIDWEYPATPERGGNSADTENYVSLVKEMSNAFAGKYGISLTLAPDYVSNVNAEVDSDKG